MGIEVGVPSQFLDIGYLAHTQDPLGFSIELLQTTFETNAAKRQELCARDGGGLGQQVGLVIGQITIRTACLEPTLCFYQALGMKVLSVQPVSRYGFELYFLAFTDEDPPNVENLQAVENREWCWQRPYTTLEIQHYPNQDKSFQMASPEAEGLESLHIKVQAQALNVFHAQFTAKLAKVGLAQCTFVGGHGCSLASALF
jgi:catechol 2,3-dioxygenase-like lactoylglutathione lyase family enzyme